MSLWQTCVSLVRKYGPASKIVTTGVLNVVAPGSGALVELAGHAIDAASESAEQIARADWERQVLARLGQSEAELARLAQLLEYLTGPLAAICDKAAAFADQPADLPEIIQRAIAANPSLSQVLHQMNHLKEQFGVFQADIRRLAERQDEAAGVYARMHRMADYFDELWQAGVRPQEFVRLLQQRAEVVASIERGQTQGVDAVLLELRTATPKAASVPILEAAAAVRAFDYPAAQRALDTAVRLKPDDTELLELSRRVTGLTNRARSNQPSPAPAAAASAATTGLGRLQPGDELDGWRLGERLGAGGWGQVFRATRGGQTRALKVLHTDYARDRRFVERFKKEIGALQRLPRHANLVRIDDFGYCEQRRTWYLTMEYVEGPTLERYLAEKGPLSEGEAREWFTAVVDGLAQAHAVGIVHRDIKPVNLILRASDRRLVLVDFGLAVELEDLGHTRVGGLTVDFAAPEQHYGKSGSQASDVFSLCAVMHYALHYDKPEQRKPHRFTASLAPASLREAMSRGLVLSESERLANAGQLREALAAFGRDIDDDFAAYQAWGQRGVGTKGWLQERVGRLARWQEAAAQNHAKAMVLLGDCYEEGVGVRWDYAEAMRWYRKAADVGNSSAMTNIGRLYRNGWGVPQDYAEAMRWFRKAADAGNSSAMTNIGRLYRNGWGVPQDYAEAMRWFRKAADAGNSYAMNDIGRLYRNGWGVPQDYAEAMRWFRQAADAGSGWAMINIGTLYQNGWGVPQDYAEAMRWFRQAAEAGSGWAMINIGTLYQNGWGVPQDFAEAIKWYRKAADAGRR
jgi:TPR repeat protein/predicted Ser/Thr protein kinase